MGLHSAEWLAHLPGTSESATSIAAGTWIGGDDWYRDLVEHSDNLLCVHDLAGHLLAINPAPARVLGYAVEELLSIPMREVVAPEFRASFDAYLERIKQNAKDDGYLALLTRSGERRIWQYHNTLRTEGLPAPLVRGMAWDVTEQKRAERALRASEARFRVLYEKSPLAICVVDSYSHRFVKANAKFCEISGRTEEELQTLDVLQISHPDDTAINAQMMSRLAAGEIHEFQLEKRFVRPDGSVRWAHVMVVRTSAPGEPVCNMATVQDITERKEAEAKLLASEAHFRMLIEQASDGIFLSDPQGRYVDVNSAGAAMLGYTREEVLQRSIADVVAPEEIARVHGEVLRLSSGATTRAEWMFRRKDGSLFPGEVTGRQLPDGRLQGILRDLSERRQSEKAQRESESRLAALVGSAMDAIISVDQQRRILLFNHAAEQILGCPAAEAMGQPLERFIPQRFRLAHSARMQDFGRVGAPSSAMVTGELWALRADGQEIPIEASISRVEVGGQQIFTVILRDITERKRVDEELRRAQEKLAEEKLYLEQEASSAVEGELFGQSAALRSVLELVAKVAPSNATVLLLGETGTGKELIARAVHRLSRRQNNSFIKMNCAAIPTGLLESELFGHERGAFTGAVNRKLGRLELADQGTIFLDEIGEIPLGLQPKLLRVLQDQEFERLGSTRTLKVDFRLIAATNRDLLQEVRERRFRSDLYYRLHVFPIRVPPLRERREDIPILVEHFVKKFASRMNKSIPSIPGPTMQTLLQWEWPGNVRELENFIERAVILTRGSTLQAPLRELLEPAQCDGDDAGTLRSAERYQILRALRDSCGQLSGPSGAAARLGLPRTTLQSKLKQLGIDHRQFRE